jgi:hypothetical protein
VWGNRLAGHLDRCSWSAVGWSERLAPGWLENLGAGAWNQLASGCWRGGVSSNVGASWVCEYRFALAAFEINRFIDALLWLGQGVQIDLFGTGPCSTRAASSYCKMSAA